VGSALYFRATLDEKNIRVDFLKQAMDELDKGLLSAIKPKDAFYLLKLGIMQSTGNEMFRLASIAEKAGKKDEAVKLKSEGDQFFKSSADLLELVVKLQPTKKDFWSALYQTYIQLGNDLRAILTIERAQALGLLNTPKETKILAQLYYNSEQYSHMIDVMEPALQGNNIESSEENWSLLVASYQQLKRDDKLLDVLKEASKRFPDKGVFDQQIGYTYFGQEKLDKAYEYFAIAVAKGGFSKPAPMFSFTAYLAYELKKLEEALGYISQAIKHDPANQEYTRMKTSIEDSIKERDALRMKIERAEPKKS
jgi:tetratricopeptide (TPR) repeat protein